MQIYKRKNINGNFITYVENNNQVSKTVVFIHGNSLNTSLFKDIIESDLFSSYRMIAIELPGHGKQEASEQPENQYAVSNYIEITTSLIKELKLKEFVIFGHSLGGHIAINTIPELPELKGIILVGTPPLSLPPKMEECFLPNPAMGLAFKPDLSEQEIHHLAENYLYEGNEKIDLVKNAIAMADGDARAFIGKSIATELKNDETILLKNAKFPVAIFHGKHDKLVNLDYLRQLEVPTLWRNEVQVIKDGSHCPFMDNPSEFNALLEAFLSDVFSPGTSA